jgi:hypothetical protein
MKRPASQAPQKKAPKRPAAAKKLAQEPAATYQEKGSQTGEAEASEQEENLSQATTLQLPRQEKGSQTGEPEAPSEQEENLSQASAWQLAPLPDWLTAPLSQEERRLAVNTPWPHLCSQDPEQSPSEEAKSYAPVGHLLEWDGLTSLQKRLLVQGRCTEVEIFMHCDK